MTRCVRKDWLPAGLRRLAARKPDGVPIEKIAAFTSFGWEYANRRRAARTAEEMTAIHLWAGQRFNELILERGLGEASGIYTFNSAGLWILREARARGLRTVMEQTSAPVGVEDRLLGEEARQFPRWEAERGEDRNRLEMAARERAEWEASDVIICGSEFTREGVRLVGGPSERCVVVPYGIDASVGRVRRRGAERLRVLYVGGVRLQKGVAYLAEAGSLLPEECVEIRAVGEISLTDQGRSAIGQRVDLSGPVPRSEMHRQWAWADVLVFPTLCDGFGLVQIEAIAAGLPVVTTPNAGSVVREGKEGFIVPIRDAGAIAERLERLATEPGLLEAMSEAALLRAGEFTVAKYGERLLRALT